MGCSTHGLEQSLKVMLEVAIVGQPSLGFEVQSYFDVRILDLQGSGKAG